MNAYLLSLPTITCSLPYPILCLYVRKTKFHETFSVTSNITQSFLMHLHSKPVVVLVSVHKEVPRPTAWVSARGLIKKSSVWWLLPWILTQWTKEGSRLGNHYDK